MPSTILIADDHDDNRELMRLLLAGAGYDVREARDGKECLSSAQKEPPDLIVMDEALDTGFSAYLSKPYSSDALLETIATVLENRPAG